MNEQFYFFMIVASIVWGVLCIILFFKVWGMTNDVKAIRELMRGKPDDNAEPVAISAGQETVKVDDEAKPKDKDFDTTPLIWIASALLAVAILYIIFFTPK